MSFAWIAADGKEIEVPLTYFGRHFLFYFTKGNIMFTAVEWRNRYLYG